MRRLFFFSLSFVLWIGCGSEDPFSLEESVVTQIQPVITRLSPATGTVGDTITLFGAGFSTVAQSNIVSIGGTSLSAESYSLVASPVGSEIESLTVTLPAGVTSGTTSVFVTVFEFTSNSDITFTVTP